VPGGAEIGLLTDQLIASFKTDDPAAAVPALLVIRAKLAALPTDPLVADKRIQLDHLVQACLGLSVQSTLAHADVVPGESMQLRHTAVVRSSFPVRWLATRLPDSAAPPESDAIDLVRDRPANRVSDATLSIHTPLTQPYWLREERGAGLYTVTDPNLIGRPVNPPDYPVTHLFAVGGQTLVVADEPVQITADPARGEIRRPLEVVAPAALSWAHPLELLAPGATKTVTLDLTAARPGVSGALELEVPAGWRIVPVRQEFHLGAEGERTSFHFAVTAPMPGDASRAPNPGFAAENNRVINVRANIGSRHYHRGRSELRYDHLPVQLLQADAGLHVVAAEVAVRAKKVGYLAGAGDSVAEALEQLNCQVQPLTGADLTPEKLTGLDAVVIGVRAFNERTDLKAALPGLFAWVEAGGTVVAQYNRPNGLKAEPLGPYPLSIEGPAPQWRVTDELAPVTFLAADHAALKGPNQITPDDFVGWVQERGAYFPSSWDKDHYTALLAMNDAGEAPLTSSILVARHGKGYYVYTGVAFFRQLPAGVPGAYRLFANLLSLGK
jgi:hypothetical protein